jgi:hypothetical protein
VINQSQLSKQSVEGYINPRISKKEGGRERKRESKKRKKGKILKQLRAHSHTHTLTSVEREIAKIDKESLIDLHFYKRIQGN